MNDLTKILNNPEEHYPGNFDTPQRANAVLTGLCQDAAKEIAKLQAEVLEQCRINGMSAEREDALRAELTRIKASIALDKMAENARELGLSYDDAPKIGCVNHDCDKCKAVQEPVAWMQDSIELYVQDRPSAYYTIPLYTTPPAAQPAVQDGRDWSLLEATQESLREHMAEIKRLKAEQPVPVKTYSGGKPWPVAPKPWVGLTDEEVNVFVWNMPYEPGQAEIRAIEAKLKGKNHG
jgi:hypothetical protein